MKRIMYSLKIAIIMIVAMLVLAPGVVGASNKDAVCEGAGIVSGSGAGCGTGTDTLNGVISKGLNFFSAIIGVIAVVMIMIGGIKYITSQGDSSQISSAKNTVLYAVIGLVVVAISQVIVHFVIGRFT